MDYRYLEELWFDVGGGVVNCWWFAQDRTQAEIRAQF